MALIDRDELLPLLACPVCGSPVEAPGGRYRCSSADCRFGGEQCFPMADGQPVLVDFEQSILAEEEVLRSGGGSPIARGRSSALSKAVLDSMLPANLVAAANAERLISLALDLSPRPFLLIVGGASPGAGTEALYQCKPLRTVAFDIYASPLTHFVADAHRIPLGDETVDAVWVQAVLEHVLDPWAVVAEIHRVLKPGGLVYAETPFLQQVHEGPFDFTRFTESGHRWMFRRFEAIDSGVALGPATQLLWSIDHLVRGLLRSVRAGVVAKLLFFWLKYLDRLVGPGHAVDAASAVFFLGRKSGREIRPRDMIAYYKGAYRRS